MYKKTITYKDFDEKERIEDVYFNLTKTELIDFALELPDNVSDSMANDQEGTDESKAITKVMSAFTSIFKFLKDLILKSYGVRKDEGRRFAKVDENGKPLSIEFSETMAFEAIMDEFMSDDKAAAEFVNMVIPQSIADKMPNVQNIRKGLTVNK